jgi:flavin-dependent dehydrogenase
MRRATDVFVIGGGPAGLAAAIAARQHGLEVVVADGSRPPIDKPCGEGLMPDGRAALAQLGISIPAEESHPFRGIRFVSGSLSIDASFPDGSGIGVRRTALHRVMIDRAQAAGVFLLWQTPVTGLHPEGILLGKELIRSRWIVGADGGSSLVRRWAHLDHFRTDRTRFAFRRHYRIAPWSDCMELHWGAGCQIYVTPVAPDEICVALVSGDPHLRLDNALAAFPEIALRLRGAATSSPERGAISSTRKLREVYQGRVALVGDASGAVDSITGEGLCLAFRQAQVLAECFASGDLSRYQRRHRVLARRPAMMARLMLALDWRTSLRHRVMRAFDSDPELFRRMVAVHVGALSPLASAANGLSLGLRLCFAGSDTA